MRIKRDRKKEAERSRKYRATHPERHKAFTARWKKKNPHRYFVYRVKQTLGHTLFTAQDFKNLSKKQKGRCAICRKKPKKTLHIDHCHKKKNIRGLLCHRCNVGLGYFLDNKKNLINAIKYLCKI